jgi:hypothetical protein
MKEHLPPAEPNGHGCPALNRSRPAETAELDPRIEDYLDRVCAPLVEVVPYAQRQELRAELQSHLEALAASYEELGHHRELAMLAALRQFGDPNAIGLRWVSEWRLSGLAASQRAALKAMQFGLPGLILALQLAFAQWIRAYHVDFGSPYNSLSEMLWLLLPAVAGFVMGLRAPARRWLGGVLTLAALGLPAARLARLDNRFGIENVSVMNCQLELAGTQLILWLMLGMTAVRLEGSSLWSRLASRPLRWTLR